MKALTLTQDNETPLRTHFGWDYGKRQNIAEFVDLDDWDLNEYKHVTLKPNEILIRYKTNIMINGQAPLLKVNIKSSRIYFLSAESDTLDRAIFETKGIKASIYFNNN